jgi:hypothetical protein
MTPLRQDNGARVEGRARAVLRAVIEASGTTSRYKKIGGQPLQGRPPWIDENQLREEKRRPPRAIAHCGRPFKPPDGHRRFSTTFVGADTTLARRR